MIYAHVNPDADAFCSASMVKILRYDSVAVDTNMVSRCVAIVDGTTAPDESFVQPEYVFDHHEGGDLFGTVATFRDPEARSCTMVIWKKVVHDLLISEALSKEDAEELAYYATLGYLGDNAMAEEIPIDLSAYPYAYTSLAKGLMRAVTQHTEARIARAHAAEGFISDVLNCGGHTKVADADVFLYICEPGGLVAPPATCLSETLIPSKLYPAAIAAPIFAGHLVHADTVIVSDPDGVATFKGKYALKLAELFGGGGHATSAGGKGFTREAFDEAIATL